MRDPRRRILEVTVAGALTVCAGLLLIANARDRGSRNVVDRTVLAIASPLERAVAWVVGGVGDLGNRYVWLRDVDDENRELRRDNEKLRLEIGALRQSASDTATLERLLAFKKRVPARTVGARLIAGSLSPQYRLIHARLDQGEGQGEVRAGMPVVTGDGLVGRIESVYGKSCEILLVTDPRSSIDVVVEKGGRGVLSGVADDARYAAKIEQLDRGAAISVGDSVTTSGLGGALPAGVRVGTVVSARADPSSLYQNVAVAPAVDFSSLDRMLILLTVPPAADDVAPANDEDDDGAGAGAKESAQVAKRVRGI